MECTALDIKKANTFDTMLNDRIECFGVLNTLMYLLDNGFTKDDLLRMRFDEYDIDEAINGPKEEEC